jgi:hypothetical protein
LVSALYRAELIGEDPMAGIELPTAEGILSAPQHLTDFQEEFLEARQTILAQRGALAGK